MRYSFYYPLKNKIFVARNAEFFENSLTTQEASESLEDLEIIQEDDTTRRAPDRMCLHVDAKEHELRDLGEPANYKAYLVDLPSDGKTVGSKWLFKKKTDMDGAVHTFKARLVAKGFTQTYGVDYEETFSPVADIRAIRILIAIAAFYDYEIWQMDVKTAFLNGHLSEEVYMVQPEASGSYVTFLILYVDDILIMGNNIPMLQDVKSYLGRCFAMKDLGEAEYILGTKIYRDRSKRKAKLSKSQGASTPAEKQRMQNVPHASTVRSIMVSCYTDAGYVTDTDDLKSQTGYTFVLNGGAIDWKSTKQSIFATSSTEAEYIAAYDVSKEAV
ncbi:retrotransposon protein, putative, ty1-copia subclass [Tanacetum coccineum]